MARELQAILDLSDMTSVDAFDKYEWRAQREYWPPTEPRLLANFRWADEQVSLAESRGHMRRPIANRAMATKFLSDRRARGFNRQRRHGSASSRLLAKFHRFVEQVFLAEKQRDA